MSEPNPEGQAEAIKQALFRGEKIEAIKLYREQTKLGLAESKVAMEALEAELRKTQPESFAKPATPAGKGCSTQALAGVEVLVALAAIVAALRHFAVI